MEQLADKGNGNCFYVDSLKEARKVFETQLTGTLEVIAKDVKFQVEFNPKAVSRYRLMGYENRDIADKDFRNDKVDAGEIGAGHTVTALYEVELTGEAQDLATVRIRAKAPNGAEAKEQAFPLSPRQPEAVHGGRVRGLPLRPRGGRHRGHPPRRARRGGLEPGHRAEACRGRRGR